MRNKLQSMRIIIMTKILLAIALAAACSTTALATQGKSQALTGGPYVYGTEDERLKVPQRRLGGFNRGDPNDPYGDPCISYQRSWGSGACGGH
jgi:hypothetical protein